MTINSTILNMEVDTVENMKKSADFMVYPEPPPTHPHPHSSHPHPHPHPRPAGSYTVYGVICVSVVVLVCVISQCHMYAEYKQIRAEMELTAKLITKYEEAISKMISASQHNDEQVFIFSTFTQESGLVDNSVSQNVGNTDKNGIKNIVSDELVIQKNESSRGDKLMNLLRKNHDNGIADNSGDGMAGILRDVVQDRVKRSDDDGSNNNRNNRGRNNRRRHGGNNQDAAPAPEEEHQKVTTVLHLELKQGHVDPQIRQGQKISGWQPSDEAFNTDQNFATFANDQVTIKTAGIYLIYSQVTFLDSSGRWSYAVTIQEPYRLEKPFIKCLSTEWGIEPGPDGSPPTTFSQCYTAAVAFVRKDEVVRIKSMYDTDSVHTDTDMSFWGFVKLS